MTTVGRIIDADFSFNAGLIVQGYNTGIEYVNTLEHGNGDVPYDVITKTVVSMSVEDGAVVLLVED